MEITEFRRNGAATVLMPQPELVCEQASEISPAEPRGAFGRTRVQVDGKFLRVNGRRFWIKGVTYGTFSQNEEGEPYPPCDQVRRDFEQMRAAGINTVRLYTPPS